MDQNNSLRNETPRRKPFIKVLVSVLVAALAAFVMIPLTTTMTTKEAQAAEDTVKITGDDTGVNIPIQAIKTLDGATLQNKQFQFQLMDGEGNVLGTTRNNADGSISFNSVKITPDEMGDANDKIFTYKVKEINDGQSNIKYDSEVKDIQVKVTKTAGSGTVTNTEVSGFPTELTDLLNQDWGQNTDVQIEGPIVKDENGNVITGAQVTLLRENGREAFKWLSGTGSVSVKLLEGETYTIKAAKNGYSIPDQTFKVTAQTTSNSEGATGIAANWETYTYVNSSGGHLGYKTVTYNGRETDVTYCINRALTATPSDDPYRYGKQLTAENLAEELNWNTKYASRRLGSQMVAEGYLNDSTVLSGYDALPGLKKILWNGYPNNTNYTYEETQRAVFAWAHAGRDTKAANGLAYLNNNAKATELYNMALNGGGKEVPEGFNVNIYSSTSNHWGQSLIGGRFHGSTTTKTASVKVELKASKVTDGSFYSAEFDKVTFSNIYEEEDEDVPLGVQITGNKIVENADVNNYAGKFVFDLYETDASGNKTGTPIQSKTNDSSGQVTFDEIKYTSDDMEGSTEKTFTYIVKERGNVENVTNDATSEKKVTVTVKGKEVAVSETGGSAITEASDFPTKFTQYYSDWGENTKVRIDGPIVTDESGVTITEAQISLIRKSSGAVIYRWLSNNDGVDLTLMNGDTYILRAAKNGYTIADQVFTVQGTESSTSEGAKGIPANWETYTYVNSSGGHLGYKTVTYNGRETDVTYCINRALTATPSDDPYRYGKQLTAENLAEELNWNTKYASRRLGSQMVAEGYLNDSTVLSGYDALPGLKKILWNGYPNNTNYTYEETQRAVFAWVHAGRDTKAANGLAYLNNNAKATELYNMALNGGGKEVPEGFNVNIYSSTSNHWGQSLIGGYFFQTQSGVKQYTANVKLIGKQAATEEKKTIEVTSVEAGSFSFTNTYEEKSEAVDVKFQINKSIDGGLELKPNMFEFKLTTNATEGVSITEGSRWTSVTGNLNRPLEARITKAGTYEFTITENADYRASGVDYTGIKVDAEPQTIKVEIGSQDGKLVVKNATGADNLTYTIDSVSNVPFTNHSESAKELTVDFQLKKVLNGENAPTQLPWLDMFAFTLSTDDTDGVSIVQEAKTRWTALDGSLKRSLQAKFTKAGEYNFTISEDKNYITAGKTAQDYAEAGIKINAEDKDIKVIVGVNSNNELEIKSVEGATDYTATTINAGEFGNTYGEFAPTKLYVQLTKSYDEIGAPELKANMFKFVISGPTDGVTYDASARWTSTAGTLNRPLELTISKAGEYEFKVSEDTSYRAANLQDNDYKGVRFTAEEKTLKVKVDKDTDSESLKITSINDESFSGDTYTFAEDAFKNNYDQPQEVTAQIQLKKILKGDNVPKLKDKMFEFTISGGGDGASIVGNPAKWTGSTDSLDKPLEEDGMLRTPFEVKFTKAGTYTFTISENKDYKAAELTEDDYEGISLDAPDKEITVVVEANSDNNLEISSVEGAADYTVNSINVGTVANSYEEPTPEPIIIPFQLTKIVKEGEGNRQLVDKMFEFYLTSSDPRVTILEGSRWTGVTTSEDRPVALDGMLRRPLEARIEEEGTYEFTISEKKEKPANNGVAASNYKNIKFTAEDKTFKVVVKRNDSNKLEVTEITESSAEDVSVSEGIVDAGTFFNTYEEPRPVEVRLTAAKELSGENAPTLMDAMFSFGLYDAEGNLVSSAGGADGMRKTKPDGTLWNPFNLTFNEEGIYKYTIKEDKEYERTDADYTGISKNAPDKEVVIEVVYNSAMNMYEAYVTVDGAEVVKENSQFNVGAFTNTYSSPSPVEVNLTAKKELSGIGAPEVLEDAMFSFGLYDSEGRLVESAGGIDGFRKTKSDGTLWNPFVLSFDEEGIYTYTIKEDKGYERGGIDYTYVNKNAKDKNVTIVVTSDPNANAYVAKVTVSEEGEDSTEVSAEGSLYNIGTFTNTYYKEPEIGTTATDASDNNTTLTPKTDVQIKDVITYKNLIPNTEYTVSGELHIKNADGKDGGVIPADAITSCVVEGSNGLTFTPTEANGSVNVIFTIDGSKLAGETLVVFEEVYENDTLVADHKSIESPDQTVTVERLEPVSVEIKATKALKTLDKNGTTEITGDDARAIKANEFEFVIEGTSEETKVENNQGKLEQFKQTRKNDANGVVTLAKGNDLTYTKAGTYEYKITENTLSNGTIDYNPNNTELTVTVKVEADPATGKLVAKVGDQVVSGAIDAGTIENTYTVPTVKPTELVIEATKVLAGRTLKADEFEFTLSEGDTVIQTVKNAANGKVTFGNIVYTVEDLDGAESKEFTYTVKEVVPADEDKEEGMTYDTSSKTVTVTVSKETDNDGNEYLVAKQGDAEVVNPVNAGRFTNSYVEPKKPEIGTKAEDAKTGEQIAYGEVETTIIDTVEYKDLEPGKKYTMEGTLQKKNIASNGRVSNGGSVTIINTSDDAKVLEDGVTVQKTFTASETGNGTVELTFVFDGKALCGTSVVAFETAKDEAGEVVAEHKIITSPEQTVDIPDAKTTATDAEDNDKYLDGTKVVTVKDVVKYTNLIAGKTYTVTGTLHDKETGEALTAPGTTESKTFTADAKNGEVELTFNIDARELQGKTFVAFEEVTYNNKTVAVHADINDEKQTVYVPDIKTTATDRETEDHIALADEEVTIVDVVEYKGLIPGKEYTMTGQLHLKSDEKKTVGEEVTEPFTASETGAGTVELTFTVNAKELAGDAVVAFETCKEGDKEVAVHADIEDATQTVEFPEAKTNATDKSDGDKYVKPETVTIVDKVTYKNLIVGKKYTISGTLHIKKADGTDGGVLVVDGKEVTATKTFTATQADGSETLEFKFNASALAGETVVAFEKVSYNDNVVAVHENINDEDQTVVIKEPEKVTVKVTKSWDGEAGNAVTVKLTKNGSEVGDAVTLNAENNWAKEWTGLDKLDAEGKAIKYSVVEVPSAGYEQTKYTSSTDADGNVTVAFINKKIVEEKISVTVNKTWAETATAKPISVQLMKNGKAEGAAVELNEGNKWTYTWSNLAKVDASKKDIEYTVEETLPETGNYFQSAFSLSTDTKGNVTVNFTNDQTTEETPEYVEVKVTKAWEKADETAPVTVKLTKNGSEVGDAVTLNAENNWTNTWSDLILIEDGKVNSYDVVEEVPEGFEQVSTARKTVNGNVEVTFTNKKTPVPGTVSAKVTKTWVGEAPADIEVTLKQDGADVETVKLSAANKWTKTWNNLESGHAYDIVEKIPEGYTQTKYSTKTDTKGNVEIAFENTKNPTPDKTKGEIATQVVVNTADGAIAVGSSSAPATITAEQAKNVTTVVDNISYTGLRKDATYKVTGQLMKITDDAEPEAVAKAEADLKADGKTPWTITFDNVTLVPGTKYVVFETAVNTEDEADKAEHKDVNDNSQTVVVENPDAPTPEIKTTATDAADGDKNVVAEPQAQVNDVVKYSNLIEGKEYTMKGELINKKTEEVVATAEQKFTAGRDGNGSVTLTFTFDASKLAGEKAVAFEKAYEGETLVASHADLSDADQTVDIIKPEIKTTATAGDKKVVELVADKVTTVTIKDVVTYTNLTEGKTYTMSGQLIKKSDKSVITTAEATFTAAKGGNGTVTLEFKNVNADLLAGDAAVAYEKASNAGGVVAIHEDINDADQTVTVTEKPETPDDKTITISKQDLGGKELKDAQMILTGENFSETWISDGKAPHKVTLKAGNYKLFETVAPEGYQRVTTTMEFTVNADGTVTLTTTTVDNGGVITVLNGSNVVLKDAPEPDTPEPETTEVTVTKTWSDNNDQDGMRPASIRVKLYADGVESATTTLRASTGWTHTWKDLAKKNAAGNDIVYTVAEDGIAAGYTAAVDGFTINNSHTPETVNVSGTKTWNDNNNQDGIRPASIKVNLLKNGNVEKTETVTAANNWSYSWTNLPKFENGKEITYTVSEDAVADYTTTYNGTNITNSYTPGKTGVTVTKIWDDDNDADKLRPESITVKLMADGADVNTVVLNAANGWAYTWTDLDKQKDGKDIVYTVDEVSVPAGYTKTVSGTTITNTHTPDTPPEEDEEFDIYVSKTDLGGTEVAGATIVVTGDGFVETWESTNAPHLLKLTAGEYSMVETVAPEGYQQVKTTITFTVTEEGKVILGTTEVEGGEIELDAEGNIILKDAPADNPQEETFEVNISKTDLGGEEIEGAKLIVIGDGFGEEWTSTTEPHTLTLKAGAYKMVETVAPEGFVRVTTTIEFTVGEDGTVTLGTTTVDNGGEIEVQNGNDVILKDAPTPTPEPKEGTLATRVHVNGKTSASATEAVEIDLGATVGTVIITDTIDYTDLQGGVTYEVTGSLMKIVNGEAVGDPIATQVSYFTADASGNGTWTMVFENPVEVEENTKYVVYETAVPVEGSEEDTIRHENPGDQAQTVVVKPFFEIEEVEVEISKADAVTSEELPGAYLIIRNASQEIVADWTSTSTPHKVKLAPGTYTLTEITAPEGYDVAETITFKVTENGVAGGKVIMRDAHTPTPENPENPIVEISKADAVTSAELPGAELIITDTEGLVVAHWVSTEESKKIHLAPGTYTLTELTAPNGYMQAESIVFEVGADGLVNGDKVTMYDDAKSEEFVKDEYDVDVVLNKTWTDADGKTVAWPAGRNATFTLQYYDGKEWKNYINYGQTWTVTLDANNPSYTFYNLPGEINGATAKYRAVETKLEGYDQAISTETDFANKIGEMNAVNKPEIPETPGTPVDGGKEPAPTPGTPEDGKTTPEQENQKPGDENGNPTSDGDGNQSNTNVTDNTSGKTTVPGRSTSGSSYVPSTTRRVVTPTASGASTVSSSRATATGDNDNSIIWIVAAALAAASIAAAAVIMRRRRHED